MELEIINIKTGTKNKQGGLTRSQKRYREYLETDLGVSFGDFLKHQEEFQDWKQSDYWLPFNVYLKDKNNSNK